MAGAALLSAFVSQTSSATFSNPSAITIPAVGTVGNASPYPSTINVSGLAGTITDLNVSLLGVTHTFPRDIDVLLIGPNGNSIELMTDVGGDSSVSGVNLVFDDSAANSLTPDGVLASGTYRPSDPDDPSFTGEPDVWPLAPAGPYGKTLSGFNGSSPNGDYNLYVVDDLSGDAGSFSGGWSITLTVPEPGAGTLICFGLLNLLGCVRGRGRKGVRPAQ
jgi:subtilisin-like proprotein convertase family protein